jgi:stage II sporulation protein AA (anti-sigma F factor antagonist)
MKPLQGHHPLSFSKKIPSRMTDAESLCLGIRETLQANDLSGLCFPVELLARECLANAVNHGCHNDASKSVVLRLWAGRGRIRLQISDEGPRFAWRKASRKRLDPTKAFGRGLQLCALYAERVRFNRCGNQITLWISMKNWIGKEESNMDSYVIEQKDQQGSVKLTGDLTAVMVPDLQANLKDLPNKGASELVFDLESAAMLDSSGMGLLIAAANSLAPRGGKVCLTNVRPDIFRLLQSMRLTLRLNVSGRAE